MKSEARTTLGMIADALCEINAQKKSGEIILIDFKNQQVSVHFSRSFSGWTQVYGYSLSAGYVRYRGAKRKYISASVNLVGTRTKGTT